MSGGPVLVVDDDTVSRHVLGQALANAWLPYVTAQSGGEALQLIDREQPSIVLLDLVMPPPDGYQILRIPQPPTPQPRIPQPQPPSPNPPSPAPARSSPNPLRS